MSFGLFKRLDRNLEYGAIPRTFSSRETTLKGIYADVRFTQSFHAKRTNRYQEYLQELEHALRVTDKTASNRLLMQIYSTILVALDKQIKYDVIPADLKSKLHQAERILNLHSHNDFTPPANRP